MFPVLCFTDGKALEKVFFRIKRKWCKTLIVKQVLEALNIVVKNSESCSLQYLEVYKFNVFTAKGGTEEHRVVGSKKNKHELILSVWEVKSLHICIVKKLSSVKVI